MQASAEDHGLTRMQERPVRRYHKHVCGPMFVYLCSGEVRVVSGALAVRLNRGLLVVVGERYGRRPGFYRKDVYFCSRSSNLAPAPA